MFETEEGEYKFEYSWMYNSRQIAIELPWYEIPAEFNHRLELVSGQRLHLENIEAIIDKTRVLDKYQQPATKCCKLRTLYFRKVIDEMMKRWS